MAYLKKTLWENMGFRTKRTRERERKAAWSEARRAARARAVETAAAEEAEQQAKEGGTLLDTKMREGGKWEQTYRRPSLRKLAEMGPVVTSPEKYSRTYTMEGQFDPNKKPEYSAVKSLYKKNLPSKSKVKRDPWGTLYSKKSSV